MEKKIKESVITEIDAKTKLQEFLKNIRNYQFIKLFQTLNQDISQFQLS